MSECSADQGDRSVVVSVIDDHPDLRHGVLARLPQASPLFMAGVKAATVPEFLELDVVAPSRTDIVLLDLTLKDGSSPGENVARLKTDGYAVMIYTGEERAERLQGTLGIGADGLVRKEEAESLEEGLCAIVRGDECWVSPLMAEVALVSPRPHFSPTQTEVLQLYATGLPTKLIASARRCSEETVKTYLKEVKARYEVLGDDVHTRTDLLRVALRDRYVGQDWFLRRK